MKKTQQVNIGGFAFSVDEEAYNSIDTYLQSLKRFYSANAEGPEIIQDIEERLGELLCERCGTDGVVSEADARYAIGILGTPADIEGEDTDGARNAASGKKRLYRNPDGKMIGGVCSGFATYLNWDVSLIRLVVILLTVGLLFAGHAIFLIPILYVVCWIAMPNADTVQKQCELRGEQISAAGIGQQYAASKPAETRPAGKTAGRVLGVILGIILFLSGLSALSGGVFAFCLPSLANLNPDIAEWWTEIVEETGIANLLPLGISTMIVAAVVYAIPCILAIYYGVLLTFNLRSPKWRPGLILLIIWALAVIALAILVGVDLIKVVQLDLF